MSVYSLRRTVTESALRYHHPKTNEAAKREQQWLDFLTELVKSKICIHFLSKKELQKVIQRARKKLGRQDQSLPDPDLPEYYTWDENQVTEWIEEKGFSHLKDVFMQNKITGRKLVAVDANALIKMGFTDIAEIRKVTQVIRDLATVPRPNNMRALMRLAPFEIYLKRRALTGKTYDNISFESFCTQQDFPYEFLMKHDKNAQIPCTCPVTIYPCDNFESATPLMSPSSSVASSDDLSITNAPTVEFVTRNAREHNKIVKQLIDQVLTCIFEKPGAKGCEFVTKTMQNILHKGCSAMNLPNDEEYCKERLTLATNVTKSLLQLLTRTSEVLQDIQKTREHIKENVTEQIWQDMRNACTLFLEDVLPITSLLSLDQLTLESIFKQEPTFVDFVDSITEEAQDKFVDTILPEAQNVVEEVVSGAEGRTNAAVPEATEIVDQVIHDAEENVNMGSAQVI